MDRLTYGLGHLAQTTCHLLDSCQNPLRVDRSRDLRKVGLRPGPLEGFCRGVDGCVEVDRRDSSEQVRIVALFGEGHCELCSTADRDIPVVEGCWDVVELFVVRQHGAGRLCAPSGQPRETVSRIADQPEVVGDGRWLNAELFANARFVVAKLLSAIVLDDVAIVRNALCEVFVGRADENLIDLWLVGVDVCCGAKSVIGLVFDHWPDNKTGGSQDVLEQMKLRFDQRVDVRSVLVVVPQFVSK